MGMAASQARLLSLTARIHDVEYQAQSIQNAKVQLATQEDQVYREYQEALDATTLTFTKFDPTGGQQSTVAATFNNLFSSNRALPANGNTYALFDSKGRLIVDSNIAEGYEDFKDSDFYSDNAYAFAMYMMTEELHEDNGYDPTYADPMDFLEAYYNAVDDITTHDDSDYYYTDGTRIPISSGDNRLDELVGQILDVLSSVPADEEEDFDPEDAYIPADIYDTDNIEDDEELMAQYEALMNQYNSYVYSKYAALMCEEMGGCDASDFDMNKFNYYVRMYNILEQNGGMYVSIDDFNGPYGDASNDSEWLTNMLQCGQLSIKTINFDKKTGKATLEGCSISADTDLKYTTTTEIDKAALAKAEAKYEHDLKLIDKKDKQLDLSLSKLETERNALTTEYDSVKKVIQDNIDRTFGIFS